MLGKGFIIGVEIANNANALFWGLMIFNIVVYAILIHGKSGYFNTLFNTLIFNRYLVPNSQEILHLNNPSSTLLSLTYFTTITAFIARFTDLSFSILCLILFVLIVLTILKFLVMRMIIFISKKSFGIYEHRLNHHIFFQTTSVIITIVLILSSAVSATFFPWPIWIILGLILLALVIRELQSLIRALNSKISVLYIILYLCSLEIVPLLVLFRVIMNETAVLT